MKMKPRPKKTGASTDWLEKPLTRKQLSVVADFMRDYESPLVLFVSKFEHEYSYAKSIGVSHEDAEQALYIGLLRAAKLFDPKRGVKISTYGLYWMRAEFWRVVRAQGVYERGLSRSRPFDDWQGLRGDEDELPRATHARLMQILDTLPEKTRYVIRCRFGIGSERMKLEEIAVKLGITRERVRQIQNKGLEKLRERIEQRRLTYEQLA